MNDGGLLILVVGGFFKGWFDGFVLNVIFCIDSLSFLEIFDVFGRGGVEIVEWEGGDEGLRGRGGFLGEKVGIWRV